VEAAKPPKREDRKAAAATRQARSDDAKPLRKELNRIDNRMGVLHSERDALEATLSTAKLGPAERADAGKRMKAVADELEQLEGRWLELSTQIDALTGG
jgi:ATP-binding cassette subfamily F protein 3